MGYRFKSALLIAAIGLLSIQSCQTRRPEPVSQQGINHKLSLFEAPEVPVLELDYTADCRIQVKTPTSIQHGRCRIIISHQDRFLMTLYSPLGNAIMVLYMDQAMIQLVDHSERILYRLRNDAVNRKVLPAFIDLSIPEFQTLFWGRRFRGQAESLQLSYRDGRLHSAQKITADQHLIVAFRSWLQYDQMEFPQTLIFEELKHNVVIKLVVTRFLPGLTTEKLFIERIPDDYRLVERLEPIH